MVIIVMGVSGSGKTHVGKLLAEALLLPFYDADNFHPPSNVAKMEQGNPLTDADRLPWLTILADKIKIWNTQGGAVLACSALKESYRIQLSVNYTANVRFVYLQGSKELILNRMLERDHFFPPELLDSQFADLEEPSSDEPSLDEPGSDEPQRAITVSSKQLPEVMVEEIVERLGGRPESSQKKRE
ncbi:MAG: gluconokinase [Tunicatimonas sp.]